MGVKIPTSFEVHSLNDRTWTLQSVFPEEKENSAFSKARQLDLRPEFEGVRLLKVVSTDDDPRQERLIWITEGLDSKKVGDYPIVSAAPQDKAPKGPAQFVPTAIAAELSINPAISVQNNVPGGGGPTVAAMPGLAAADGAAMAAADPTMGIADDLPLNSVAPAAKRGGSSDLGRQVLTGFGGLLLGTGLYAGVLVGQSYLSRKGFTVDQNTAQIVALLLGFSGFASTLFMSMPNRRKRRQAQREERRQQRSVGGAPTPAAGTVAAGVDAGAGPATSTPFAVVDGGLSGPAGGRSDIKLEYESIAGEFIKAALERVKTHLKDVSRHIAFGLNLFFAAAIKRLAQLAALDREHELALAAGTLAALGTPAERAEKLMDEYDTYRRNQSYVDIMEAGERAADAFVDGSDDWGPITEKAISRWVDIGNPFADGIVTIMFTDIVGSTQMTHERGDYGAQEVVRMHNTVVRKALAEYFGKEVKHTGDGIMAVFSNAVNAVGAAMVIQHQLAVAAQENPKNAAHVRIGINSGEAVHEEGDYFGTTVQVAARVCDKASAGEIFVTESVKMMCADRKLPMAHVQAYELKGVDHLVDVYRIDLYPAQAKAKAS